MRKRMKLTGPHYLFIYLLQKETGYNLTENDLVKSVHAAVLRSGG